VDPVTDSLLLRGTRGTFPPRPHLISSCLPIFIISTLFIRNREVIDSNLTRGPVLPTSFHEFLQAVARLNPNIDVISLRQALEDALHLRNTFKMHILAHRKHTAI
jgi:hypothetical protein